eukprot:gene29407-35496_t
MADNKQQTIFHILEYLNTLKGAGANADNIDTITSLIESEFNVAFNPDNFKLYSTFPAGLDEIIEAGKSSLNLKSFSDAEEEAKANPKFNAFLETVVNKGYFKDTEEGSLEYLRRYAKLVKKFQEKAASAGPSKEELEKQAEEMKIKGNTAISQKDYKAAAEHYSEAIKLSSEGPNSHVYYCNRAAAYCYLSRYEDAVSDCLSSVALSPDYVKAFSRLGLAYYHLEKFQEALDAYERAAELEPDNAATKDSIRQVKTKMKKVKPAAAAAAAAGAPDLSGLGGLMNNPAMKKAFDQVGGTSGLANLMKDPNMMAMAQQMMKDPNMMQQAMAMMGGMGGGGGGMPDMSALAGLMGGLGGGAGAVEDEGAPPSSSNKAGKKPFKGFEE